MKTKILAAVFGAMVMSTAPVYAGGVLDAYMPGEMMGMHMTESVFNAFFSDKEGKTPRDSKEFMGMYEKMSMEDKMVVRVACSTIDKERASFSDHISSACKAAGL